MVTLHNRQGVRAEIVARGAALASLWLPDRSGAMADVVLGHGDDDARQQGRAFFGASIGRVAGRIRDARFVLDGAIHALASADSHSCLHGGPQGFDTRDWQWLDVAPDSARLQLVSAHGDQGFPGQLTVTVAYRFDDANGLHVDYSATCDRPTVVNLTHHPFWNLAGEGAGSVEAHQLTVPASTMLALDDTLLPTGQRLGVAHTAFDFRTARAVGEGLRDTHDRQLRAAGGYDHYWILDEAADSQLRPTARLCDPHSGRVLELLSNQPGVQIYSGNFLDGSASGRSGRPYRAHAAICLEPQGFPDAPNQPTFPSIRLQPGQTWRNHILYRFSCLPASFAANAAHAETGICE